MPKVLVLNGKFQEKALVPIKEVESKELNFDFAAALLALPTFPLRLEARGPRENRFGCRRKDNLFMICFQTPTGH